MQGYSFQMLQVEGKQESEKYPQTDPKKNPKFPKQFPTRLKIGWLANIAWSLLPS